MAEEGIVRTLEHNVTVWTMESTTLQANDLDCRSCGVCCASLSRDTYQLADVSAKDLVTMRRRTVRLHVLQEGGVVATRATWKSQRSGPLAGSKACVCSALRGSVLSRVNCAIYEERPEICRNFEVGGKRCREIRALAARVLEDVQGASSS